MNALRKYHRWIGIVLGVFFIVIAVTGIAMQVDMYVNPPPSKPPSEAAAMPPPPAAPENKDIQWHYVLQDIHAGYYFGGVGKIINVICGLGLLVLSITGLWVYVDMFRRRRKTGKWQLFWQ